MNGTLPPFGPLSQHPRADSQAARRMLMTALSDLQMGTWDVEIRSWLLGKDPEVVATIASWLVRAWQAGLAAGLDERRQS